MRKPLSPPVADHARLIWVADTAVAVMLVGAFGSAVISAIFDGGNHRPR